MTAVIVEISIAVLLNARDNIVDTLLLTVTYSVLHHHGRRNVLKSGTAQTETDAEGVASRTPKAPQSRRQRRRGGGVWGGGNAF